MVALRSKVLLQTKKLLTHDRNEAFAFALVARQTTKLLPGVPAASGLAAEGIIAQNSRHTPPNAPGHPPRGEGSSS